MSRSAATQKKNGFQMPDTYVIVFFLVIFAVLLAYLIPAGSYKPLVNEAGKNIGIDPNSFAFTQAPPLALKDIFGSLYSGLINGSSTIFLVLIIGGVFQIIIVTGALDAIIGYSINMLKDKAILLFPCITIVMILLGSVGIGNNVAVVFTPIGIILCKKFRLDPIVAVAIFFLASNTGFSGSPINPFTILLAQELSGVPYMSGLGLRSVVFVLTSLLCVAYVTRYCVKVRKDPSASLMQVFEGDEQGKEETYAVSTRQILIFLSLVVAFSYYTWGAIKYNWGLDILSAIMVALGLLDGIIGKLGPNEIARSFVEGCKQMVFSAVLIGFAGAITVVLNKAGVIHSIVYYLCIPLAKMHNALAACAMFVVNSIINIFIPSGSGQAYVTIPLMAPMADVLGFSRQIAIAAFQYGDGFMNEIQPTSGLLMGCIGIAGVPFTKWLKFALPLFAVTAVFCMAVLVFAVLIGWN